MDNNDKLKILQLGPIPAIVYGGVSTFIHETSRYIQQLGHEALVAPLTSHLNNVDNDIESECNYRIVYHSKYNKKIRGIFRFIELVIKGTLKPGVFKTLWSGLKALWIISPSIREKINAFIELAWIYDTVKALKVDLIIGHHGNKRGWMAILLGKILGIQGYPFLHGGYIFELDTHPEYRHLAEVIIKHGQGFLFCSSNSIDKAQELGMRRDLAIHVSLGSDINRIKCRPIPSFDNKFQVTFMGYLSPQRGLKELMYATAKARNQILGLKITIVGDDFYNYWPELEKLIFKLKLVDNIEYLGKVKRASYEALLTGTHVVPLLLHGPKTGSLATCLESQAAGIPILTTGLAGVGEYVIEGKTAVICDTSYKSVAAGLIHIYRGYEQGMWKPETIREWAASHSWKKVAENIVNVVYHK